MKNNKLFFILFLIVVTVFFLGVINLFHVRFKSGDIYPAYSSLRSDPLGTKVLFESLNNIRQISAVRNYHPLNKMRLDSKATYLFLGIQSHDFRSVNKKEAEALESILAENGRIVMTFLPEKVTVNNKDEPNECGSVDKQDKTEDIEEISETENDNHCRDKSIVYVDLAEKWGVTAGFYKMPETPDGRTYAESVLITDRYNLPDTISWHSRVYFEISDNAWEKIYEVNGHPVLIERTFGNGRIILASDTYFTSNEAMLKERLPGLLAWIPGKNRIVVFDETHHGITEQPNIAALARKYRLHGLFAGLLLLSGLFIWKNSSSFMPPDSKREEQNNNGGSRDYISGLVSMLRRNIKSSEILTVCFSEWEKSIKKRDHDSIEFKQAKDIVKKEKQLPEKQRAILKSYKSISQILTKRRYI